MPGTRVTRTRSVVVVLTALSLLLVGSGAAWASWVASRTVTATGAAAAAPVPVLRAPVCSPGINGQNDPVVLSWDPIVIPGATQVRYRVKFTPSTGASVTFPTAAPGTTTATTISVAATQIPTAADRTKVQSITLEAWVDFPGTTWTAAPSNMVTAQGQTTFLGFIDMNC
ncbi:hypothetical protein ASD16_01265 [Cellulomonas sp. Root485]|uniref:hypothetical protein n=1 Tax=Cellulomonas sp. Root485 TaxID=1736546 RepID=UPI0007005491|nr:hypothetical protein [Cellulomonas sp. Root485]KQY24219.1 hypothetical protein ASD16_01265 [Cellulomonas sp. Root485]